MRDAKRFEHSVCARSALRGIKARNPVLNVLFDAEMRKQSEVLKDVTDPARTHRDFDSQALVKPALVCERNVPCVGPNESGKAVQQRGFACSGGAKTKGHAGSERKINFER